MAAKSPRSHWNAKKVDFFIANLCFLHFSWKTIKTEVKQDAMKDYLQTLTEYLEVLQIK